MTHHAIPAPHYGHSRQGPGTDIVARGTSKGQPFGKRCNNGIGNRGLKEGLHLGSSRTLSKTFRQSVELEFAKQTVGTSIRLQKMSVRTLWRGQPLLK
jgi:hypothetical protein